MCKVAIAEDRPEVMEIMERTCKDNNYEVVATFKNFHELKAFANSVKERVDCILLDTTLPYVTLEKSLDFMKRKLPKTKVLLVGNGVKKGMKGKFAAIIEKPLLSRVIIQAIRDAVYRDSALQTHY